LETPKTEVIRTGVRRTFVYPSCAFVCAMIAFSEGFQLLDQMDRGKMMPLIAGFLVTLLVSLMFLLCC
jgi:hypothetical protein